MTNFNPKKNWNNDRKNQFLFPVTESSQKHLVDVKNPTKPFGTDDGFKGAGAACGSSIVKVARQMVSGKSLNRGFTVAK